jgi:hypothetical protein
MRIETDSVMRQLGERKERPVLRRAPPAEPNQAKRFDSVEISDTARDRLSIIQERVRLGFYGFTEVTDDLSEKLANLMAGREG